MSVREAILKLFERIDGLRRVNGDPALIDDLELLVLELLMVPGTPSPRREQALRLAREAVSA